MGQTHDEAVEDLYDCFIEDLESKFWDTVLKEQSYFESYSEPFEDGTDGLEVGEFDIFAYNREERIGLYVEVKTSAADLNYAYEQIERAQQFFKPEWTVIGKTYLVQ